MREEHRLRVYENIFGPKWDKVTGEWRRLHNDEHQTYYLGDKIKKNDMGESCGTYGGQERCTQGFGGET
jgi:hypothetical protein